jgi:hypothetical protein
MDTERLIMPDGSWWDVKLRLTRGDRRKIDTTVQKAAFAYMGALKTEGMTIEELRVMSTDPNSGDGPATGNNPDEDDVMLLVGTIAWSYDEDITDSGISERFDDHTDIVLAWMHDHYNASRTSEARKNLNGTPQFGLPETVQQLGS